MFFSIKWVKRNKVLVQHYSTSARPKPISPNLFTFFSLHFIKISIGGDDQSIFLESGSLWCTICLYSCSDKKKITNLFLGGRVAGLSQSFNIKSEKRIYWSISKLACAQKCIKIPNLWLCYHRLTSKMYCYHFSAFWSHGD